MLTALCAETLNNMIIKSKEEQNTTMLTLITKQLELQPIKTLNQELSTSEFYRENIDVLQNENEEDIIEEIPEILSIECKRNILQIIEKILDLVERKDEELEKLKKENVNYLENDLEILLKLLQIYFPSVIDQKIDKNFNEELTKLCEVISQILAKEKVDKANKSILGNFYIKLLSNMFSHEISTKNSNFLNAINEAIDSLGILNQKTKKLIISNVELSDFFPFIENKEKLNQKAESTISNFIIELLNTIDSTNIPNNQQVFELAQLLIRLKKNPGLRIKILNTLIDSINKFDELDQINNKVVFF